MVVEEVPEEVPEQPQDVPVVEETPKVMTLEILKIIKEAQQQHGLRHGDFQRYRGYCSRRIRRLRKVLHITQSEKRRFKKKDINEAMVVDEKFLYMPLMMAERCWSHAMQLRQEANTEPRKRYHHISRLRKATVYCLQLQKFCELPNCDARTKLEAQAYVSWIHGSLHFELHMWLPAMENLKKAQMVYEKLAEALPEEDKPLYLQRVDELAPSLRFCAYNIGDESAIDDLLKLRSQGHGDLIANLDTLMVQTREKHAGEMSSVEWRGRTVTVRPERARIFLLAERDTDSNLKDSADISARIEILETLLMDCKDAIAAVKEEMKQDPATKNRVGYSESLHPLQYLLTYLLHIRLSRTVQRNLLLVEQANIENAAEIKSKNYLQDLTRLYEIILQNLQEMQVLPGLEEDATYQKEVEAKITAFKAFRCFYIAKILVGLRRWREGMALYQRSEQYVREALKSSGELKSQLEMLKKDIEGCKFAAHAHSVLEGEEDEGESSPKGQRSRKPLADRLGEYREDPALTSKNPNVYRLPPDMKPVPCKPLFFDLALNWAEFPSLDDKIENAAKKGQANAGLTGFVKGFLGWGGSKS
ncbi:hypothetical protein ONE63_008270 [Megalurothrips usitatus]|uniref:Signal recognition particle subunit SRP68 n=1 Tax=Megalurothrips usitatus TaxID=439358 RepID=A0AAV7XKL9_9NEOP|nr:hypothetical protein ONE63_008270 [Megalurothrips usitatus]